MPTDNENAGQQEIEQSPALRALKNLRMRLLDLTGRNRLINFKHSKRGSLRVIDELPNQLVETLLSDTEMRFEAIPEPTEEQLIAADYLKFDEETRHLVRLRNAPSAEEWARHLGFATSYEVSETSADDGSDKHSDNVIQTLLYPYEMEARLKGLQQTAQSSGHAAECASVSMIRSPKKVVFSGHRYPRHRFFIKVLRHGMWYQGLSGCWVGVICTQKQPDKRLVLQSLGSTSFI